MKQRYILRCIFFINLESLPPNAPNLKISTKSELLMQEIIANNYREHMRAHLCAMWMQIQFV